MHKNSPQEISIALIKFEQSQDFKRRIHESKTQVLI